jgi:endo-1,4-beta-xylanase
MRTRLLMIAGLVAAGGVSFAQAQPSLKEAFKGSFVVGAALNNAVVSGQAPKDAALVAEQFDSCTPENVLKWAPVHPQPDVYNFAPADRFVEFGEKHHMYIVGHTLVWHSQTPAWVFRGEDGGPASRELLLKRMREHIHTVVGRYKGRIQSWDVVNEALNEDGTLRPSLWLKIIGEDYIAKAFEYAHEADPDAQLNYNDYSLPNSAKRDGAIALIKKLKAAGVPVGGIGMQGHYKLDWPSIELMDEAITAFSQLGVKVMLTELDIDVLPQAIRSRGADVGMNAALRAELNPYVNGLPEAVQQELAKRYAGLFRVFLKHSGVLNRVTFWGVTNRDSWLNHWPVRGRTNYPLLFGREGQPTPAFEAVIQVAAQKR